MTRRRLYLHIGASKTGTSALQAGIFASAPALAEQGLGLPLVGRDAHVRALLRPLGWRTAAGFVRDVVPRRLDDLAPLLAATPGERLLVTNEDLCEADEGRIRALVSAVEAADLEVHVVLTVRSLAAVLPSEWQQFLKHRLTLDYPTFLERVRDRRGRWAEHFWRRQDPVATSARWATVVGADRLDVIVTPDRSVDPEGLYRMFGEVVGFAPDVLTWPDRDVNASWGYVEAEVYRRLNQTLGNRLTRYERDYQPAVRWPLVQDVLARSASGRITLPPDHLGWVRTTAEGHVAGLRETAVRMHGDLAVLVPSESAAAPLPALPEEAVAQAAIDTLANFAVFAHRRSRRSRRRRPGPGRSESVVKRVRLSVARRLRRGQRSG